MQVGKVSVLILLLLTLQSCFIQPGESKPLNNYHLSFTAKVIRILDGDTMEVLYQDHPIKIRLAHIDCPEAVATNLLVPKPNKLCPIYVSGKWLVYKARNTTTIKD